MTRVSEPDNIDYYAVNGDFSLSEESPAVDTGSASAGIRYDLNWNLRDDKPDIGAFEYQKLQR
jgi:hypothetical protein